MPLMETTELAGESFPRPFAGLDEAGRGCLAGPVVAAAVILPPEYDLPGLTDSKKLTEKHRLELEPLIKAQAIAWGIGVIWPLEIDRTDILRSSLKAMCLAVDCMKIHPVFLVVDGNQKVPSSIPQATVVRGDSKVPEISAASVLAKTLRDRVMIKLDRKYPGYAFAGHKGYGSKAHMQAIRELGPCRMHRMTFRGVKPEKPSREQALCLPGI
ncbi:ribonuclease HII [Desulfovibrio ferrophilus]|uniref:Ribonuclease HII n=1 Tax=Desulfovibrio ferrophilus TaxID=241368 RepID=A0A2Z6B038_9BACT|nr:ribonuclease HII [Desulfovibrio ferrophilus]BBD08861.1 ribonuclease H [Desulfovibrio ferrophilus]